MVNSMLLHQCPVHEEKIEAVVLTLLLSNRFTKISPQNFIIGISTFQFPTTPRKVNILEMAKR